MGEVLSVRKKMAVVGLAAGLLVSCSGDDDGESRRSQTTPSQETVNQNPEEILVVRQNPSTGKILKCLVNLDEPHVLQAGETLFGLNEQNLPPDASEELRNTSFILIQDINRKPPENSIEPIENVDVIDIGTPVLVLRGCELTLPSGKTLPPETTAQPSTTTTQAG